MKYEGPVENLVRMLARLPGLGSRSARRMTLHLLTHKDDTLSPLIHTLQKAAEEIKSCSICGNLDTADPCHICRDERRDTGTICVVANVADLWAIERTGSYKGRYFVLGGVLSAMDGNGPEELYIPRLIRRIEEEGMTEVILALSATVEGQSTAHYIADQLAGRDNIRITRLAHGVPVGGELDYLDEGTIVTALKSRGNV